MCLWCLQYEGSVEENTIYVEAIRIKAIDRDEIHTENWEAVYTIVSGNEAGYFNITTDRKTNEGILMVTKVRHTWHNWWSWKALFHTTVETESDSGNSGTKLKVYNIITCFLFVCLFVFAQAKRFVISAKFGEHTTGRRSHMFCSDGIIIIIYRIIQWTYSKY